VRKKTLDLGRIGARNGPDRGLFAPEPAQRLAQDEERLLQDAGAKKPSIWAVSAPETAQMEGFCRPKSA
jgi:hypothetical protein